MLLVQEITPEYIEREEGVHCDVCTDMSYSYEDYKTLYAANKLIYFYIPEEQGLKEDISVEMIMCYSCLFKYIQKISGGSEQTVIILGEDDGLVEHTFTVEELDTGNPHYFDFLKDDDDIEDQDQDQEPDDGDGFLPPPDFRS